MSFLYTQEEIKRLFVKAKCVHRREYLRDHTNRLRQAFNERDFGICEHPSTCISWDPYKRARQYE